MTIAECRDFSSQKKVRKGAKIEVVTGNKRYVTKLVAGPRYIKRFGGNVVILGEKGSLPLPVKVKQIASMTLR